MQRPTFGGQARRLSEDFERGETHQRGQHSAIDMQAMHPRPRPVSNGLTHAVRLFDMAWACMVIRAIVTQAGRQVAGDLNQDERVAKSGDGASNPNPIWPVILRQLAIDVFVDRKPQSASPPQMQDRNGGGRSRRGLPFLPNR